MKKLEIVIPIYNEESCIHELYNRLNNLDISLGDSIEVFFIFINDGSNDESLNILLQLSNKDQRVKLINFSRNFGHQLAITAGLDYADADYVAIIDADLQDPPEAIKEMIFVLEKNDCDLVYAKRIQRKGESFFKKLTAKLFYIIIEKLCDVKIPRDTGDFRLFNRKVLLAFKGLKEKHRFIRGMFPWIGFKSISYLYRRDERYGGETKFPFNKMFKFALDAIFSFSKVPLRIVTRIGLMMILISFGIAIFMLYIKLFTSQSVPGITVLSWLVVVTSGAQFFMLGIFGEYLGRIFDEAKNRPLYVVSDTCNF